MPRSFNPDMSANGSIATVTSSAFSEKADCPNHSTRILLLLCHRATAGGRCQFSGPAATAAGDGESKRARRMDASFERGIVVAARIGRASATQQRRGRRHQAGEDREQEGLVQARLEGAGDEVREEG